MASNGDKKSIKHLLNRIQYRPEEAADVMGVSLSKMKTWIRTNAIHSYTIDGMRFVAKRDLLAFIEFTVNNERKKNKMNIRVEYLVDTKTDELRILRSEAEVIEYLASLGLAEDDCYIDRSNEYRIRVEIPSFKEAIAKYKEAKSIGCARWGCE